VTLEIFLILYFSYLLGSIPSGVIFSKLFSLGDLRNIGSGNIGATNVFRSGNYFAAILTLLLDLFKAYLAISICYIINSNLIVLSASIILLGHIFPIWLTNLRGGKGFASFLGITFAINSFLVFIVCLIWILIFLKTKMPSLATLISAHFSSLYSIIFLELETTVLFLILNIIIIFSHQENIKRIVKGTENKVL
jgi:glycerol-3-phosphate acyltransferase PlsY